MRSLPFLLGKWVARPDLNASLFKKVFRKWCQNSFSMDETMLMFLEEISLT